MELQQPGRPGVHQVGEHRERPDDVEVAVRERQGRFGLVSQRVERRAEVALKPIDALGVDVAAPDLGRVGLVEEVAQRPSRAAAEVEQAASLELVAGRQHAQDLLATLGANLLVEGVRILRLSQAANPVGQRKRRHRDSGCHSANECIRVDCSGRAVFIAERPFDLLP